MQETNTLAYFAAALAKERKLRPVKNKLECLPLTLSQSGPLYTTKACPLRYQKVLQ
jgi:hypothetical protein